LRAENNDTFEEPAKELVLRKSLGRERDQRSLPTKPEYLDEKGERKWSRKVSVLIGGGPGGEETSQIKKRTKKG